MKIEIEVDEKELLEGLDKANRQVLKMAEQAMNDAVDEIVRIASEITPFDKGILQKSHSKNVKVTKDVIEGEIEFSVREGNFNYALWTHEGIYNYGEGTLRRPGTVGWSGRKYEAGRKYLERPIKGEEQAVRKHIAETIRSVLS